MKYKAKQFFSADDVKKLEKTMEDLDGKVVDVLTASEVMKIQKIQSQASSKERQYLLVVIWK